MLDEVGWLLLPNLASAARSEQLISYITYSRVRRRESTCIQVEYMSDDHFLLSLGKLP
jgi:hypothetical protein